MSPTPEAAANFKAEGTRLEVHHRIYAKPKAPIPDTPPAKRRCGGCGLNRNAFATRTEFDTHETLCLLGGLAPGR